MFKVKHSIVTFSQNPTWRNTLNKQHVLRSDILKCDGAVMLKQSQPKLVFSHSALKPMCFHSRGHMEGEALPSQEGQLRLTERLLVSQEFKL